MDCNAPRCVSDERRQQEQDKCPGPKDGYDSVVRAQCEVCKTDPRRRERERDHHKKSHHA